MNIFLRANGQGRRVFSSLLHIKKFNVFCINFNFLILNLEMWLALRTWVIVHDSTNLNPKQNL